MFKALDSSDITIRRFKVFKNWSCDEETTSSLGIIVQDGVKDDSYFTYGDSQNIDGSYKKLIWSSIRHIYYYDSGSKYMSGSNNALNTSYNILDEDKIQYISRSLSDGIRVLNIPNRVFGEQIKPTSITLETASVFILDDGNYNLYVSGSNPRTIIGNVFYDTGQLVITSQSYTNSLDYFDLSFQSTVEIKEMEISCNVLEGEYNYTSNISALSGSLSGSREYKSFFTSASIRPLITTIGLYDDENNLVIVGKLGKPFKREYDLDTTFVLRIDL